MERSAGATLRSCNTEDFRPMICARAADEVSFENREQSFGQYLRRQRILRGITREEVLRVTKVQSEYFEALEGNRFDGLPPKAFVVGFLRVFSEYAGLDADEVITRFLAQCSQEVVEDDEPTLVARNGFLRRNRKRLLAAIGFASLVVLMIAPHFRH